MNSGLSRSRRRFSVGLIPLALLFAPMAQAQNSDGFSGSADQTEPAEELSSIPLAEDRPPRTARTPDTVSLENLIVTASKREQQQSDVDGTVEVLTGDALEAINAQGMADYLAQVPGVVLLERGMDSGYPVIRGIATSTAELGMVTTQLPVGIYIDDMPFSDLYLPLSVPDLNPFDLARVEVLKGPQGTLFGSGALAGALRYVTQQPRLDSWETKLRASISGNGQSAGLSPVYAGAQNLPLGQDAALRLVGHYRNQAGLVDEVDRGNDLDDRQQYSGRVQARWEPSEHLRLTGFWINQEATQENTSDSDHPDRFERELTGESWRDSGFMGSNISLNTELAGLNLLSSSNYLTKDVLNDGTEPFGAAQTSEDDPGGDNGSGTEDAGKTDTLTYQLYSQTHGWFQEFRLSSPAGEAWWPGENISVEWLVGLGYQDTDQDWQQYIESTDAANAFEPVEQLPVIPLPTPVGPISGSADASLLYAELDSEARELALFGEANATWGEHWQLSLGARLFRTKLHAVGHISGAQNIALSGETRTDIDRVVSAQGINPRLSLRYIHSPAWEFYAMAGKGFQFGGVQVNPAYPALATTLPRAFENYASSKLWNYEVGLRSLFYQGRLRLDLSAFYMDWQDLQISVRGEAVPAGSLVGLTIGFIENIGRARSHGLEARLVLTPSRWLNWSTNLAWIDAQTGVDFDSAAGFVEAGTRLPASPRLQGSNRLTLRSPEHWWGRRSGQFSLQHSYIGQSYNDLQYSSTQGDYHTLDANLLLNWEFRRVETQLGLSVINLADERGVSVVSGVPGSRDVDYFLVRPRSLLLSIELKL